MSEPVIEQLHWWEMIVDGTTYVRLGENNWAEWMGESLEIVQHVEDAVFLEMRFQAWKATVDPRGR